ncbi:MAG: tRNA (adenosine(37)-N6)-dimethylallyltransferase MiaA [Lachnospiraceae bacterium]|nr:tRNA (adenosine(37)-N6)-dimethylallyltransferase MiaA [Lachnospiraceae bacterium]
MDKLIIITGPTAVGKTAVSVAVAKRTDGEIISADSMQVYRYMDIGSAKIKKEEMEGIPHHLIDCVDPAEDFNVYRFKKMAQEAINDIKSRGKLPIIAGGTGFYIQSVLYDIDFSEESGQQQSFMPVTQDTKEAVDGGCASENGLTYRQYLEELYSRKGASVLHDMLSDVDPESAAAIHENNVKRVIRALEYHMLTGTKISEHNEKMRKKESPYDFRYYVLNMPRELVYKRIDERVDRMIGEGLEDEVRRLMDMGLDDSNVSMQGLGYKEIYSYLKGELSHDEAVRIIKRDTRHFAKRQLTWFKRERNVRMIELEEFDYDIGKVADHLAEDIGI